MYLHVHVHVYLFFKPLRLLYCLIVYEHVNFALYSLLLYSISENGALCIHVHVCDCSCTCTCTCIRAPGVYVYI